MKAIQIISQENLGVGPPGTYRSTALINREGVQAQEKAVGSLAGELAQFGQMIQTSIRRDMVSHNYALAQQEIAKNELDMQADPDHRSIEGKFDNSLRDIRQKYADAIPDPVARKVFQDKYLEYETDRKVKMKYYVYSREVETQKGHLVEELDSKARLIEQTDLDDMKNYNLYLTEALDTISQREASGVITPQKGAELRLAFKDTSAKLRVYRSIMDSPYEAYEKLSAKDWQATFPYLKEDDRLDAVTKAETRIRLIESTKLAQKKEARLVAKAEKKEKENAIADLFVKQIMIDPFKVDPMDILNSDLPAAEGANSKKSINAMREAEIEERLTGRKSPFHVSDQFYEAKLLEDAIDGKVDPSDVHAIPGKLSIDAMRTIKHEARTAKEATGDSEAKQYQELKRMALDDGSRQILLGSEIKGFTPGSVLKANTFKQNLLKALEKEKNIEKRNSMLTMGSPDYIVDKLAIPYLPTFNEQVQMFAEKFQLQKGESEAIRREAIRILQTQKMQVTEERINFVIKRLKEKFKVTE